MEKVSVVISTQIKKRRVGEYTIRVYLPTQKLITE